MRKARTFALAGFLGAVMLFRVEAQMAVTAPIMETLMSATRVDQILYYAQSLAQMVENATNTYNQFQNMLRMEQMALNNLKNVSEVKSWDDFMNWYNRQLYLERQVEQRFNNMGVKIGSETYRLKDIEDIPDALAGGDEAFLNTWKNGLSEQQHRQMWYNLGLTPSNYAYVQTWKAREKELAHNLMTKLAAINEENMAANERNAGILDTINRDSRLPEDQQMGEVGIGKLGLEVAIDTNRALRQMHYDQVEAEERRLAAERAAAVPADTPDLSERWNRNLFGQISEHEGFFEEY